MEWPDLVFKTNLLSKACSYLRLCNTCPQCIIKLLPMQGSRKGKFRGGMLVAHACTKESTYSYPILQLHKIIKVETRLELTLF